MTFISEKRSQPNVVWMMYIPHQNHRNDVNQIQAKMIEHLHHDFSLPIRQSMYQIQPHHLRISMKIPSNRISTILIYTHRRILALLHRIRFLIRQWPRHLRPMHFHSQPLLLVVIHHLILFLHLIINIPHHHETSLYFSFKILQEITSSKFRCSLFHKYNSTSKFIGFSTDKTVHHRLWSYSHSIWKKRSMHMSRNTTSIHSSSRQKRKNRLIRFIYDVWGQSFDQLDLHLCSCRRWVNRLYSVQHVIVLQWILEHWRQPSSGRVLVHWSFSVVPRRNNRKRSVVNFFFWGIDIYLSTKCMNTLSNLGDISLLKKIYSLK